MKNKKTQTQRIFEAYVTVIVLITAVMLVVCGVAISKVNTDYMQTGVRAGKIVAERENMQISVTTHEGIKLTTRPDYIDAIDTVLSFLPPPVNTTYLMAKQITELITHWDSDRVMLNITHGKSEPVDFLSDTCPPLAVNQGLSLRKNRHEVADEVQAPT